MIHTACSDRSRNIRARKSFSSSSKLFQISSNEAWWYAMRSWRPLQLSWSTKKLRTMARTATTIKAFVIQFLLDSSGFDLSFLFSSMQELRSSNGKNNHLSIKLHTETLFWLPSRPGLISSRQLVIKKLLHHLNLVFDFLNISLEVRKLPSIETNHKFETKKEKMKKKKKKKALKISSN